MLLNERKPEPMAEDLERLKQHFPLLEYLQRHNWRGLRTGARPEFVGLCPLHQETHCGSPKMHLELRPTFPH